MRERLTKTTIGIGCAAIAAAAVILGSPQSTAQAQGRKFRVPPGLSDRVVRDGAVRVLVQVELPGHVPEGRLPGDAARVAQRGRLNAAQMRVLAPLAGRSLVRVMRRYLTLPYLALEADARALAILETDPNVVRVLDDPLVRPVLTESAPLVQADQAWAAGFDGSGTTIAVLDTGVDSSHPFLGGRVVEEACYSSNDPGVSTSFCPNGLSEQVGPGAANACWLGGCDHGTHVAGAAAGNGEQAGQSFSGVAKGASLMAVQVYSQINSSLACGGVAPCLAGFTSDVIAGLERVYLVAGARHVVAVNVSLGAGQFSAQCDLEPYQPFIENLRAIGVATIAAAGNDGSTSSMMAPACVSSAVSVGATDKADRVAAFSNAAPFLSLFAPGDGIFSSLTSSAYGTRSGTSLAAAHVAGAWAVLKQAAPTAGVTDVLNALRSMGKPVNDTRPGGAVTAPRVRLYQALAGMVSVTNPAPSITSLFPDHVQATGPAFTLTVSGAGFNAFSVVRWNGANRPTTIANVTTLQAAIPQSDINLASAGTADITVFTSGPGGGTSNTVTLPIEPPPNPQPVITSLWPTHVPAGGSGFSLTVAGNGFVPTSMVRWNGVDRATTTFVSAIELQAAISAADVAAAGAAAVTVFSPAPGGGTATATFTVDPPPSLGVSATSVISGSAVTVTLTNGYGGASDWLALAAANAPDTTYLQWTYVGAGVTTRTWTVNMPSTLGAYEFRLFPNNGSTRAATSPAVAVVAPPPVATSLSPASTAVGGAAFTLTVNGSNFQSSSTVRWNGADRSTTYVNASQLRAGVPAGDLSSQGAASVTVFTPAPGGGTSNALTFTIGPPPAPSLTVSATSVVTSAQVTVTLVNGSGSSTDWLALAATSAPNTTYLQWVYVGAGVTTRSWTVNMPSTAGTYEFRLFLNGGFTRAATSPLITVTAPPPPALSVSATSVTAGSPVTVTLTNGYGASADWLALAATSAPNMTYLQWVYVGAGITTRSWTVNMPATAGTYEFRLFLNNGFTRAATSPPVTVTP